MQETQKKCSKFVFSLSITCATLSMAIVLLLITLQAYVRWAINQNFVLLGGGELEVLTVSAFASVIGLAYIYRPKGISEDDFGEIEEDDYLLSVKEFKE